MEGASGAGTIFLFSGVGVRIHLVPYQGKALAVTCRTCNPQCRTDVEPASELIMVITAMSNVKICKTHIYINSVINNMTQA